MKLKRRSKTRRFCRYMTGQFAEHPDKDFSAGEIEGVVIVVATKDSLRAKQLTALVERTWKGRIQK